MSLVSSFIENPKNYIIVSSKESKTKQSKDIYVRKCKICGKKFVCSNPKEWAYRAVVKKGCNSVPICSYSCMIEDRKNNQKQENKIGFDLNLKLRNIRDELGISQKGMADYVHIGECTISQIETYAKPVSDYVLKKYIAAFGREKIFE